VSAQEAITAVAAEMGLRPGDIVSKRRYRELVQARHRVACMLHDAGWTTGRIGRELGGRDHSTIVSLLKGGKGRP
jgi:chromosomal replication initiation ATPase DnaA